MSINGSTEIPEKTPLEEARDALLQAATGISPHAMLPSAYISGVLMAARLNALIDCVGCGDPAFQQAFDAALLAQMQQMTGTIQAGLAKPQIQIASAH